MVVYEATDEHYQKIVNFVNSQPKDKWMSCFAPQGWNLELVKWLKEVREGLRFYVCEDSTGEIRVVFLAEERMEPHIMTNVVPMIANTDRQRKSWKYVREVIVWLVREFDKMGISLVEGVIAESELDIISVFKGFKLVRSREVPEVSEKVFLYTVDLKEALSAL